MKKLYIAIIAAVAAMAALPAAAQERFDNNQWSIHFGTLQTPTPTFLDHRNPAMAISINDYSTAFPWGVTMRFEHEKVVSDLFGYGFALSAGVRHTGWNYTIPKGTPYVDNTYLGPTDADCNMYTSLLGFTVDGGAYAALHPTNWFQVYATVGVAVSRWWEGSGSKLIYNGYELQGACGAADDGIAGTLLGTFAQVGMKFTFNEDFFFSLSARLVEGFNREGAMSGTLDFNAPFYSCGVNAPFSSEWMLLAGIGVMIEE